MELSSLLYLFPPLLLLLLFNFFHKSSKKTTTEEEQGYKPHPLLGSLLDLIQNRDRFIPWMTEGITRSATHTITFTVPGVGSGILTANPANVEHILKNKFDNYCKGERTISMLKDFLGHGIFNSDGERWRNQRKTASYEFNKRSLRNFVMGTVQQEISDRLLPLMGRGVKENDVLDLQDVLERFAFDNICKVAFGEDPCSLSLDVIHDEASVNFAKAFDDASFIIIDRLMEPLPFMWKIKKLLNIGTEKRLKESIRIVENYAMKIVKARKEDLSLDQKNDLLSRFATTEGSTEEFLRDIVISFMIAGRETTSSALVWFFWILSSRPDVEKKILEEVRSIRACSKQDSSEGFTFDELREMHYLHAAISESLRLYPPVAVDTMSCKEDDILPDGTMVKKGWTASYSSYAMGRMRDVWGDDCEEYKPERWLEKNGAFRPESPFKFTVFHAGPRMCLGKEMAYIQMKSVVACMLERFEVDAMVDKVTPPDYLLSMTFKMKNGLPVRIKDREAC